MDVTEQVVVLHVNDVFLFATLSHKVTSDPSITTAQQ